MERRGFLGSLLTFASFETLCMKEAKVSTPIDLQPTKPTYYGVYNIVLYTNGNFLVGFSHDKKMLEEMLIQFDLHVLLSKIGYYRYAYSICMPSKESPYFASIVISKNIQNQYKEIFEYFETMLKDYFSFIKSIKRPIKLEFNISTVLEMYKKVGYPIEQIKLPIHVIETIPENYNLTNINFLQWYSEKEKVL